MSKCKITKANQYEVTTHTPGRHKYKKYVFKDRDSAEDFFKSFPAGEAVFTTIIYPEEVS